MPVRKPAFRPCGQYLRQDGETVVMACFVFDHRTASANTRYIRRDALLLFELRSLLTVPGQGARFIPEEIRKALQRLARVAKLVVVTDSPRIEVAPLLGFEPHQVLAIEAEEAGRDRGGECLKIREELVQLLRHRHDLRVEFDGESVQVHFCTPEGLAAIDAAVERMRPVPRVSTGRSVVNLSPPRRRNPDDALAVALSQLDAGSIIYFTSDEEEPGTSPERSGSEYRRTAEFLEAVKLAASVLESEDENGRLQKGHGARHPANLRRSPGQASPLQ
jgi:hypothetical protein